MNRTRLQNTPTNASPNAALCAKSWHAVNRWGHFLRDVGGRRNGNYSGRGRKLRAIVSFSFFSVLFYLCISLPTLDFLHSMHLFIVANLADGQANCGALASQYLACGMVPSGPTMNQDILAPRLHSCVTAHTSLEKNPTLVLCGCFK